MSDPSCIVVSSRKGRHMPKFYVEMRIDFNGEIEAESAEEAEKLAWTSWGDTMDNDITYDNVYDITVTELDEEDEDEDDE
jgi:hypothetical protein